MAMLRLVVYSLLVGLVYSQCSAGTLFDTASNRCIQFFRAQVSFTVAESICATSEGHLISVTNAIDNSFISNRALEHFDGADSFWIGAQATAKDVTNPLNWVWTDGNTWAFNNWKTGEPTSQGSSSCAKLTVGTGKWQTANCSSQLSFACAYSPNSVATCPTPTIPSHCPSGYAYFSTTDYCYKNTVRSTNFNDARSSCHADGGELASIHSQAENDFLVELSKTGLEVKDNKWNDQVWIGFIFDNNEWKWTDDSTVDYINWGDGEPNVMQTDWWTVLVADPHEGKNPEFTHWNNVGHQDERAYLCKRAPLH